MIKRLDNNSLIRSILLIFLGFFLTSTAWLSWEYHLLDQIDSTASDICTMIIGYMLQALGIGIFAFIQKKYPNRSDAAFYIALIAHGVSLIPSITSPFVAGTLTFGFIMNTACGVIAGAYLYDLAANVPESLKATSFGAGYGLAILSTWLLSLINQIYYSEKILIICLLITVFIFLLYRNKDSQNSQSDENPDVHLHKLLIYAGILVVLFSIVNSSGFAFPSSDIGSRVNTEFSRLAYAAGLIIAGIVNDRSRKYGAVLALSALMMPFIIMALRGESLSAYVFWLLSYFIFGFYAVYRIILFSDIATKYDLLYLSGFGLLIGRIGDALGEALCIAFGNIVTILVILSAALFALAVFVFFRAYGALYEPAVHRELSGKEKIQQFSMQHDLSAREKDVLRLILDEHSNAEIADELFISENTVKYHIKNLLSKTGCRNRKELAAAFISFFEKISH